MLRALETMGRCRPHGETFTGIPYPMKPKVFFERQTVADVEILKITGFMDSTQAGQFENRLDDLIQTHAVKLILDFTDLDYISSASLGVLVSRVQALRKLGGDIKVGGCSSRIKDILDAFGFTKIFVFKNTAAEAIQSF
jgi:anti-sigma B factor antagonist